MAPTYSASGLTLTDVPVGTTIFWTGGAGTSDWNTAANWQLVAGGNAVPGVNDNVLIGGNVAVTYTYSGSDPSISAKSLAVQNGASFTYISPNVDTIGGPVSVGVGSTLTLEGSGGLRISPGTIAGPALTVDGTVDLGTSSTSGWLSFDGNQTIAPDPGDAGTILLGSQNNNLGLSSGTSLTIAAGITIDGGAGHIGSPNAALDNYGVLNANTAAGQSPGFNVAVGTGTNYGTIEVTASGAYLDVNGASWTNAASGAITADGGSYLLLNDTFTNSGTWVNQGLIQATGATVDLGGTITQSDLGTQSVTSSTQTTPGFYRDVTSTVNLTGTIDGSLTLGQTTTGNWKLNNGGINETAGAGGGAFSTDGVAMLFAEGSGTLTGVTLDSPINMLSQSSSVTVQDNLVLNTTQDVGNPANNFSPSQIYFYNSTLSTSGGGEIVLGPNSGNQVDDQSGALTIASGVTILAHAGRVGGGDFTNDVTITADTSGQTVQVQFGTGQNEGTVQATGGAGLLLYGSNWTNAAAGTISISGGGALALDNNVNDTWSNSGLIQSTDSIVNLGGSITQASLGTTYVSSSAQAAPAFVRDSASTVNLPYNAKITGNLALAANTTGDWNLKGGALSGGTFSTDGSAVLYATGYNSTLNGETLNSPIDFSTYNGAAAVITGGLTLNTTLNIGNAAGTTYGALTFSVIETLAGNGTVDFGGSASNSILAGGQTLTIGPNITIQGGSGSITEGTLDNQGEIVVNGGTITVGPSVLSNFASGTLSGGTWQAIGGGVLRLESGSTHVDVTTNAATIVLDGAASNIYDATSGTTNALAGLTANGAAGSLTLQNGYNLTTTAPALTNAGNAIIGASSTLAGPAGFAYTQSTGGTTLAGGTLDPTGGGGTTINGGALTGSGTISGNLTNAGTVAPGGASATGTLNVTGTYTQTSGGTLDIGIGGTAAGTYDQLAVTGAASLAGALDANVTGGFLPTRGATTVTQVLTFASKSGDFSTKTTTGSGAVGFATNYTPSELDLFAAAPGTTTYWTGPNTGGDWNTPADWSAGAVPGASDVAYIAPGNTVTFSSGDTSQVKAIYVDGTLDVTGGNLSIGGTAGSNFTLDTGGTLGGVGTVVVNNAAADTWSGGTMSEAGTTTFASGTTLTLNGTALLLAGGRTLGGAGAATLTSALNVGAGGGAVNFADLHVTGGFDLTGNYLTNAGAITPTNPTSAVHLASNNFYAGGGSFNLGGSLVNTGTFIEQGAGGLEMYDNTVFQNQGTYLFASASNILYGNAAPNSFVNTGTVKMTASSGTASIQVPFDNQGGTLDAESGTLEATDGGTNTGGAYLANGTGVVDLTGGSSPTFTGAYTGSGTGRVQLASGTFNIGGGGVTFNFPSGLLVWSGGTLTGGTATNLAGGFMTITGGTLGGTLSNQGTITQPSGALAINGGVSNAGVYDLALGASGNATTGAGVFTNTGAGTLQLTTSITATLTSPFANQGGTVDATAGTLVLGGGGASTGGAYEASSGAAVDLAGATTSVFNGGVYTNAGAGTIELSLGGAIAPSANGATLDFTAGSGLVVSYGGFNTVGHTLTNAGTITLTNASGTKDGLDANNFYTGGGSFNLGGSLVNTGTIVERGTGSLEMYDNTILNNQGTYLFAAASNILYGSAAPNSFVNTGTVKMTASSGTASIQVSFDNQGGTLDAQSGTLALTDGGVNAGGTYDANGGGVVDLTGGSSPTFSGNYTGSGAGTISLASGTLNVGAGGASFDFSSGLFVWSGGTLAGATALTNAATGYLTVTGGTLSGTLNNQGAITQPSGTLTINGTVNNAGVYDVALGASGNATTGAGAFTNTSAGTLELTSSVTATLKTPFANQGGTVDATAGTLVLGGGGTSTGGAYQASSGAAPARSPSPTPWGPTMGCTPTTSIPAAALSTWAAAWSTWAPSSSRAAARWRCTTARF